MKYIPLDGDGIPLAVNLNTGTDVTIPIGTNVTPWAPVVASGGTPRYIYSINPALPSGMTFNNKTGVISGMPSFATTRKLYTITVNDMSFNVESKDIYIQIISDVKPAEIPTQNVTPVQIPPVDVVVNVQAGALPNTTVSAPVPVTPAPVLIKPAPVPVTPAPVLIKPVILEAPALLPVKTVNLPYPPKPSATVSVPNKTLTANNTLAPWAPVVGGAGTQPLSYAVVPALPSGLLMGAGSGLIIGTPNLPSPNTAYTVTVTDYNDLRATGTFTLEVLPNPSVLAALKATVKAKEYADAAKLAQDKINADAAAQKVRDDKIAKDAVDAAAAAQKIIDDKNAADDAKAAKDAADAAAAYKPNPPPVPIQPPDVIVNITGATTEEIAKMLADANAAGASYAAGANANTQDLIAQLTAGMSGQSEAQRAQTQAIIDSINGQASAAKASTEAMLEAFAKQAELAQQNAAQQQQTLLETLSARELAIQQRAEEADRQRQAEAAELAKVQAEDRQHILNAQREVEAEAARLKAEQDRQAALEAEFVRQTALDEIRMAEGGSVGQAVLPPFPAMPDPASWTSFAPTNPPDANSAITTPSVALVWTIPWPPGTIRAKVVQDCYTVTEFGQPYTYEYSIGTVANRVYKIFKIRNKSVTNLIKITLILPEFLKSVGATEFIVNYDSERLVKLYVDETAALNLAIRNLKLYFEMVEVHVDVLDVRTPVYVKPV